MSTFPHSDLNGFLQAQIPVCICFSLLCFVFPFCFCSPLFNSCFLLHVMWELGCTQFFLLSSSHRYGKRQQMGNWLWEPAHLFLHSSLPAYSFFTSFFFFANETELFNNSTGNILSLKHFSFSSFRPLPYLCSDYQTVLFIFSAHALEVSNNALLSSVVISGY